MLAASTSAKLVRSIAGPCTSRTRILPFEFSTSGSAGVGDLDPAEGVADLHRPGHLGERDLAVLVLDLERSVDPATAMRPNEPVIRLLPPAVLDEDLAVGGRDADGALDALAVTGPKRFLTDSDPSTSIAETEPFEPVTSVSPPPTRATSIGPNELSMRWPPRQSRMETLPFAFEIELAARIPATSTSPNRSRTVRGALSGITIV
jgi:hypothetical protein